MNIAEKLTTIAENEPKVYDAGKKSQYDEFWDNYQNYDEGITPNYAFAYTCWNDKNYNPKYPIKFNSTNLTNVFYSSSITDTKVPIHMEGCQTNNTFRYAKLVTIRELVVDEITTYNTANFPSSLVNIKITGTIGGNIDFGSCSTLTLVSVDSIIVALKTLAEGDGARTLTLHSTVKANMTDTQMAVIQEKGWTLA